MLQTPFRVLIVGCGLGGLSCAIACRREGLEVKILDKVKELKEVGAGVAAPPNATRILADYGLMDKLFAAGAVQSSNLKFLRYSSGEIIANRPLGEEWFIDQLGRTCLIHRADYHRVLYDEALRLGVTVRLDADVRTADFESPAVYLDTGESIDADVVIVADGTWSTLRDHVLGYHHKLTETGDLAYRATIPRGDIDRFEDDSMRSLIEESGQFIWIGPQKHAVLYPISHCTEYNLALLRPDNLEIGVHRVKGEIQEMRASFEGWDPRLTAIISRVQHVDKWKIVTMDELKTWVKGSVALLGDACHPTSPYQAQGAAMAIEDGAVLGTLLGLLSKTPYSNLSDQKTAIPAILNLYEVIRKKRTTSNVQGADEAQIIYHLDDGPEQEERDVFLRKMDPDKQRKWVWTNMETIEDLYGFDTIADTKDKFQAWVEARA